MKREKPIRVPISRQNMLPISEGDFVGGFAVLDANGDIIDRSMFDKPLPVVGGDSLVITYNFWNWDDIKP